VIVVDTDVLAIHHIFRKDVRFKLNERAYAELKKRGAATTIHNLLELCGLFAVAGMRERVEAVIERYLAGAELRVEFPNYPEDWGEYVELLAEYLRRGFSYGDALVALAAEGVGAEVLVTWNKRHFSGKISAEVLTPEEFLSASE